MVCRKIGNTNRCLHSAIVKLELNLFNIMLSVSQVLTLILAIMFEYILKVSTAFCFLNLLFIFIFSLTVLQFTIANLSLCFVFSQYFYKQISFSPCLYAVNIVTVASSGYFLNLLVFQHWDVESNLQWKNGAIDKTFHIVTGMSIV